MKIALAPMAKDTKPASTIECPKCGLEMRFVRETARFLIYNCPNSHLALVEEGAIHWQDTNDPELVWHKK